MLTDDKDAKTNESSLMDDDVDVEFDEPGVKDTSSDKFASGGAPEGPKVDQPTAAKKSKKPVAGAVESAQDTDSKRDSGVEEVSRANEVSQAGKGAKAKRKEVSQAGGGAAAMAWKGKERRRPSPKDVLARLLEKNEVILALTKKNIDLEAKVKDLENRRLRTAAEFENYRKRTRKEWELLKDQTKAEVLSEVLTIADDFERAFAILGGQEDEFAQGIRLIYNNLTLILEGFGITRMESLGTLFDPNLHMAVATIESRNAKTNHIVEVIEEGYLMDDAVVRVAKVVIAK